MHLQQIKHIIEQSAFPDTAKDPRLIETHISWIILTDRYAFKIKKPIKLPFLDFSTLALRNYYCRREVILNSRLQKEEIYIGKVAIRDLHGEIRIGGEEGEIIDWAVMMHKLNIDKQLDHLLSQKKVDEADIKKLARRVALFHLDTCTLSPSRWLLRHYYLFNQLEEVAKENKSLLNNETTELISSAIYCSNIFLETHTSTLLERKSQGFIRDCHGDLHAGNIFMYERPILFDCIEFNDEFREIDVLNELAFIGMELDFFQCYKLSDAFLDEYQSHFEVIRNKEEEMLYLYYKLYRANVRLKVQIIRLAQTEDDLERKKINNTIDSYLKLIKQYVRLLNKYLSLISLKDQVPHALRSL